MYHMIFSLYHMIFSLYHIIYNINICTCSYQIIKMANHSDNMLQPDEFIKQQFPSVFKKTMEIFLASLPTIVVKLFIH